MRNMTSTAFIGAFALTAALTGCATVEDESSENPPDQGEAAEEVAAEYNAADVDYISGMIPHHQQAIEMSGMVLEKDDIDPDVEALAEDIREAQGPEIEQMESWLDAWGQSDEGAADRDTEDMDRDGMDDDQMGHGDMDRDRTMEQDGMMSREELAQLDESTGSAASRMFLEQMIAHHEGAVSSAEQHLQEGANPEALELSEDIIEDQQAEIEEMEELLAGL